MVSTLEPREHLRSEEHLDLNDAEMKRLVRDLHRVSPSIYWTDLVLSAGLGWAAFASAVALPFLSFGMIACTAVAVFALYRALCFMHELSHQTHRTLPGFDAAWNLLVGYPLLMPSFVYVGVHQSHHRISTYGTSQDPEYLPFARSSRMTTVFALESFFIPCALLLRFLLVAPVGLLVPRFHNWLVVYASSLTMNVKYRRDSTPELVERVQRQSAAVLLMWITVIGLAIAGIVPWRLFAVWLLVCALVSFVNTLRTLGAHAYESSGEPLDRVGQLVDSIDTPGRFWTELWAPVGLRYHALHHYFPGIPYHSLPAAYRRIVASTNVSAEYQKMSSPSLQHSLLELYKKGLRSWE